MAEYHEAFWVAVATVGPVLALSHAVTVERSIRQFSTIVNNERDTRFNLWLWVTKRGPQSLRATFFGVKRKDVVLWRSLVATLLFAFPMVIALVGFATSSGATLDALDCLAKNTDRHNLTNEIHALTLSMAALLLQVIMTLIFAAWFKYEPETKPANEPDVGAHEDDEEDE